MKQARTQSKGFFFGYLYGQGSTIRGHTLWYDGCLGEYDQKEYNIAQKAIERRLKKVEGQFLFPLKKDEYVEYEELLILKTIYGKRIADTFLEKLTGIKELIEDCKEQSKSKGTITGIDGRELYSRSPHSALNLLLQGSAGIVAKKWMVNYHALAYENKLTNGRGNDFYAMAYIHDEFQVACKDDPKKIKILSDALEKGAAMTTQQFNLKIQIQADACSGQTWAQTH